MYRSTRLKLVKGLCAERMILLLLGRLLRCVVHLLSKLNFLCKSKVRSIQILFLFFVYTALTSGVHLLVDIYTT